MPAKRLRIAQVAPLWTSVPPATYGGAELMVHWLTEELVRRDHDVTLFASGDSQTSARLVAVLERNLIDKMAAREAYLYEPYAAAVVAEALRAEEFDLIHCHVGPTSIPTTVLSSTPVVHTIHAGLDAVDELWILERYAEVPIAAISRSQVSTVPPERLANVTVVYHGCDFNSYEASFAPGAYLAFLGRMGPHKNPVAAIRIAQACGLPIRLAGMPQDDAERRFFDREVLPLLDGDEVVHLGAIDHREKVQLLRGAAALVFPIDWEEHFGLVMIEAMACGTPVLATCRGSVPEVIDAGKTGFYAATPEDLPPLIPATLALDRRALWEHARKRFSHRRMVDDYVSLYVRLLADSAARRAS